MSRLVVLVEGQTEETFVDQVLAPHLYQRGYSSVRAHLLGNARQRSQSGGVRPWELAKRDILDDLLHDRDAVVTTMVDYYGLPDSWPGRQSSARESTLSDRATAVETSVRQDVVGSLENFDPRRFIPYVVMYEFEALLFSDPDRFAASIGHPDVSAPFRRIRQRYQTPEHIDDGPATCPSRRIADLVPGYRKSRMGSLAIRSIGLASIRRECLLFSGWIDRLEQAAPVRT